MILLLRRSSNAKKGTSMTRSILTGVATAALLSTAAFAQTATTPPTMPVNPTPPAVTSPAQPSSQTPTGTDMMITTGDILASKIMGASVYAPEANAATATAKDMKRVPQAGATVNGNHVMSKDEWTTFKDRHESIGEIEDIVVGGNGQIRHVLVGVGGFLGIGEKRVALDMSAIDVMRSEDGGMYLVVNKTKAQLEALPSFKMPSAS
jgi:hypothetical protein